MVNVSVLDIVTIFFHSIETTPALTRAIVVSLACPSSILPTPIAVDVEAVSPAIGNQVQLVSVPDDGVHNTGVVSVGLVSVLLVSTSLPARVAKSASLQAVLNCAIVPVIPTIVVWSPVFVPLDVQENVPLCVARLPNHKVVLCADASASSINALPAAVHAISSISHAKADERQSNLSVALTFCIFAYVTASLSTVHTAPLDDTVMSPLSQSDTHHVMSLNIATVPLWLGIVYVLSADSPV